MADILQNFSCSDPELSHEFTTDEVWRVASTGVVHISSIRAIAVFLILYMLIGIPWNGIILFMIVKKQYYRDPTYILLMNMVIADLIVCAVCLPFGTVSALRMRFSIGNSDYTRCTVCHTITIIPVIFTNYSLFVLALLSTDRLLYIKLPLQYQRIMTVKKVVFMLTGSILVCIISALPPVFGFGEIKFANPLGLCSLFIVGRNRVTENIYFILLQLIILAFPFSLAFVANVWLMLIACKTAWSNYSKQRECTLSDHSRNAIERRTSENELKSQFKKKQICLTQVFSAIFFINIITWIPSVFIILISAIGREEILSSPWLAFVYLVFLSQPIIHPILETCLVGKARWMFFKFLCYINICNQKQVASASSQARLTRCATSLDLL